MMLRDFNETFAPKLRGPAYLAEYLRGCLDEGLPTFYVGLRKAVQSRDGGFTWLAREVGMVRAGLYHALSANGNPSFKTIHKILVALEVDTEFVQAAGSLSEENSGAKRIPAIA